MNNEMGMYLRVKGKTKRSNQKVDGLVVGYRIVGERPDERDRPVCRPYGWACGIV